MPSHSFGYHPRLWALPHRWGFDIFMGAMGWSLLAISSQFIEIPWILGYLVGVSTWLYYGIDHALDVRRLKTPHNIGHRYVVALNSPRIWAALLATASTIVLALAPISLAPYTLFGGFLLSLFCLLYLLCANRLHAITKQLYASALFTAGIILPFLEYKVCLNQMLPYICSLYLMASAHILSSAYWDIDFDEANRGKKFSAPYYKITSKAPLISFWLALPVALIALQLSTPYWAASIGVTLISLAFIEKNKFFINSTIKRAYADGIFAITPWLFLLLQWGLSPKLFVAPIV